MSTEHRDVRPFASIPALDHLLRHAVLRYGMEEVEAGGRVILEEDVFLRAPARLVLAKDTDDVAKAVENSLAALSALDLSVDDLSFAIVISSSYLKNTEFRARVPLRELADLGPVIELSSEPRPAPFRSPRAGCTVEALVYLSTARSNLPLRPWRFGTWLARAEFEVVTEHVFTGFTPKPLTPKIKQDLGLPPKAMRYITLGGASPLEEDVSEDSVEVWFDADLLAKMSAMPRSKASVALQRQLFVDAITAVVSAARVEDGFMNVAWPDVKDTLLGRVVQAVAPSSGNEDVRNAACANYLQMIKDDAAKFLAFAEEAAGLVAAHDAELEG